MKTSLRLFAFVAFLALIATPSFAVCLTEPNFDVNGNVVTDGSGRVYASGFRDFWRNNFDKDFADYGLLFEDAKDRTCSVWAAQALRWKVEDTLNDANGRNHTHVAGYTGLGPYQNWLEGGHVLLILSAALQIGGHGDMTSALDAKLQQVITSFTSNPHSPYGLTTPCGIGTFWKDVPGVATSDTCMDDHAIGAAALAWVAAYQHKRGNTASRNTNIANAKTALNAAFSVSDSICINDPLITPLNAAGRGPCNVDNPANIVSVLTRANKTQRGFTYSFNRGQNQVYGFGLLASISAALIGLEEADATDINGNPVAKDGNGNPIAPVYLTDAQKQISAALLREAQRSTPSSGDYFYGHLGGVGNCRTFNASAVPTNGQPCADSAHRPRFYSLGGAAEAGVAPNTFFGKYVGIAPSTSVYDPQSAVDLTSAFTFDKFVWGDFTKNPETANNLHYGRGVWYGNLGYYWHTIHPSRNNFDGEPVAGQIRGRLSATYDDNNPIGFIDGITPTGVAYGWTCDKDVPATSIAIDFYSGGVAGTGAFAGRSYASFASEPAINTLCSGGTAHRFSYQLPAWTQGQTIYPYGLDGTWRGFTLLTRSSGSCPPAGCQW